MTANDNRTGERPSWLRRLVGRWWPPALRAENAMLKQRLADSRKHLRAAHRGAERNAQALRLRIQRDLIHRKTRELHELKHSPNAKMSNEPNERKRSV